MHTIKSTAALLVILLLLALSPFTFAQDGGIPDIPEPVVAIDPPPEEVAELAFLVGAWDVTGSARLPGGELADVTAFSTIEPHQQGYTYREDLIGRAGDRVVAATSLRGYSPNYRMWDMAWTDNLHDGITALGVQWQGEMQFGVSRGVGEAWELYLQPDGEDAFTLTFKVAPGIGAQADTHWTLTYTRRAEPVTDDEIAALLEGAEHVAPPPEMQQFDFWAGEWVVDSLYPDAGDWESYPARDTLTWVADGWALEEHFRGEAPFGYFEGYALSRYNPSHDGWDNVWYGTGGQRLQTYRGGCNFDEPDLCKLAGYFYDVSPGVPHFTWAIPDIDNATWRNEFYRVE